ncbi:hypothetical protein ACP4OV_021296 [Aristida adscensionis]
MIEYYDISGCYILRPWTMDSWELLKEFFDAEIKKLKLKPCYFPLFLSENVLQKEKGQTEGFAPKSIYLENVLFIPEILHMFQEKNGEQRDQMDLTVAGRWYSDEVAWITRWYMHKKSNNIQQLYVLFKTREFLWQEGHIAFATKEEAAEEVLQILEFYRRIYEEFLAVPVSKGRKSEMEKFAGGIYTTTVEAFIPNTGFGIQGATSHFLGQNFAKYNSLLQNRDIIGVMVMTHGDDKGLVLPPRVAPVQVIVVPMPHEDADIAAINRACELTVYVLNQNGIRVGWDSRENYSSCWKVSHWELKGVPFRIEICPKDLVNKQVRIVRRENGRKFDVPVTNLVEEVKVLLDGIQENLFKIAKEKRDACIKVIKTWDEFIAALNDKKLIFAPWCDEEEVEKDVKGRTKGELGAAKTLCTPFEQPELPEGILCFASGKPPKIWSFWGRSY